MTQELSISEIGHQMHVIKGHRVMLDNTLAELYHVETKVLKRAVKRNITRFPNDFMFELNENDVKNLRCQIGTSSFSEGNDHGGNRYIPFAFTEPGVAMLSSVLKSERAVQVNIAIMRAFIQLREKADKSTEAANRFDKLEERQERLENQINQVLIQLESRLSSFSQFTNVPPKSAQEEKKPNLKVESIQNAIAKYYGLSRQDLKSAKREVSIALPRQILMFLIRKHTGIGFKEIGKYFGGRDHTTVLHAYRKIVDAIDRGDESIKEVVQAIECCLGIGIELSNQ